MDYYCGEIRLFAGTYAPEGWMICDGSSLNVSEYQVLFSLIGTTYGGSGSTFNLPDLRSRVPIGQGTGNGLTARTIGQTGGSETVTLAPANLPAHTHSLQAINAAATANSPSGGMLAATQSGRVFYATNPAAPAPPNPTVQLDPRVVNSALGYAGSSMPHANIMGSLGLNYIIAVNGLFPNRN